MQWAGLLKLVDSPYKVAGLIIIAVVLIIWGAKRFSHNQIDNKTDKGNQLNVNGSDNKLGNVNMTNNIGTDKDE